MTRRLFASDYDGTLHFWGSEDFDEAAAIDGSTSPQNLAAIRAFQEAGGIFGVCTGRPLLGLTKQVKGAIPFDFYIATSGSALFDRDGACLWRASIPREAIEELHALLAPRCKHPDNTLIVAQDTYWCLGTGNRWPIISSAGSLDEIEGPFGGISIETATIDEAHEASALVEDRLGDVACAYVNLASIDVVPAGCSKGTGLARAAVHFGANLTAGIGDSFNDLPLLEAADVAYTFPSSEGAVRDAADLLVEDVAHALEDFAARS